MESLRRWTVLLVSGFMSWSQAMAVPEVQFEQMFPSTILPAFWSEGESGRFAASDGLQIHYRKYMKPGQHEALVILPGRTESTFKFAEVLYDLKDLNLAVFILDHRGQGASGREASDSQLSHVDDFYSYRDDLALFMKQVVEPLGFRRRYALAHSMGANILSLYIVSQPEAFQKVVVTSPMLDISPAPFPYEWMAYSVTSILSWLGFDKTFAIGHGHFKIDDSYRGTSSKVRFAAFNQLRASKPEELTGGVSWRFAQQAMRATWEMRKDAEKLLAPMLMMQAMKDDVVLTKGQDYVCQRAKKCQKISFPEARHELHIESDAIRMPWLSAIREFLATP